MSYSREEGIQAIIDLQKMANIDEPYDRAAKSWDLFSDSEKLQTENVHKLFFKDKGD